MRSWLLITVLLVGCTARQARNTGIGLSLGAAPVGVMGAYLIVTDEAHEISGRSLLGSGLVYLSVGLAVIGLPMAAIGGVVVSHRQDEDEATRRREANRLAGGGFEAARGGACQLAREVERRILHLDPAVHAVYISDAAVAACLTGRAASRRSPS